MTPQELKNSILQLAIQGKLVEQRPEEGTAEELFAQIQQEKQRLIAENKIKKDKPLPEITDDEKPFDIPESWMWVRLGEIFQHNTGKALNSTNRIGVCLKYITTSNLYWNRFELEHLREMFFANSEVEKCTAKKGDLLVCEGGDIGRAAIWQNDETICIQNHIHRLRAFSTVCTEFFYYLFYLYKHAGWIGGKGIGIQGLSSKAIHVLVFPLPPLAEQKRIVAKIEELLPYIDRYEQAWSKLEQFNSRFPEDMKKSLLQYAIQGKLVEQRPEEGTAEELFAQIQQEKQRLIAEKKIKKEKFLPEITDDEQPFDIPESWKWVRLVELGSFSSGKTPDMTNRLFWENGTVNWMTSKDMKEKFLSESQMKITAVAAQEMTVYEAGTLLMVVRSGILKRMLPLCVLTQQSTINQDLKAYSLFCNDMSKYVYYMLKALEPSILFNYTKRVTTVDSLKFEEFSRQMLVPLPPLAEQKRIVEKLEQLLPLCERLK